ncbi:hypothetical protein D3C75_431000 [compost metagenome]
MTLARGGGHGWLWAGEGPSEFVGVESLAITGFAARAALQAGILIQLVDGKRLLAIGAEAIEPQFHLAERRVEAFQPCHAQLHLGQVEATGQIHQLIPLAASHFLGPVVTTTGL